MIYRLIIYYNYIFQGHFLFPINQNISRIKTINQYKYISIFTKISTYMWGCICLSCLNQSSGKQEEIGLIEFNQSTHSSVLYVHVWFSSYKICLEFKMHLVKIWIKIQIPITDTKEKGVLILAPNMFMCIYNCNYLDLAFNSLITDPSFI